MSTVKEDWKRSANRTRGTATHTAKTERRTKEEDPYSSAVQQVKDYSRTPIDFTHYQQLITDQRRRGQLHPSAGRESSWYLAVNSEQKRNSDKVWRSVIGLRKQRKREFLVDGEGHKRPEEVPLSVVVASGRTHHFPPASLIRPRRGKTSNCPV